MLRVGMIIYGAEDGMKMNGYNGSQLWDTAFATRAMLESERKLACDYCEKLSVYRSVQIDSEYSTHAEFFRIHDRQLAFSTAEQLAGCRLQRKQATLAIHRSGLVKLAIDEQRIKQAVVYPFLPNTDGGWATYELTRT
jgi:lanosterol synthase